MAEKTTHQAEHHLIVPNEPLRERKARFREPHARGVEGNKEETAY
jgi:hypothetical protein